MEKTYAKTINNLDITRLKLRNISKDGYYVYVQKREVKTFYLTDEQILALRRLHRDNHIAPYREIRNISRVNNHPQYKVHRDYHKKQLTSKLKFNSRKIKNKIGALAISSLLSATIIIEGGRAIQDINNNIQRSNDISVESIMPSQEEIIRLAEKSRMEENSEMVTLIDQEELIKEAETRKETYEEELRLEAEAQAEQERRALYTKYANYYHINPDRMYEIAASLTDNFTSEEYVNNHIIPTVVCKKRTMGIDLDNIISEEEAVAMLARCLNQAPGDMGISTDNLYDDSYQTPSSKTYEEITLEAANIVGIDPALMYAICTAESSLYSEENRSDLARYSNNFSGISTSSGWGSYATKEEGMLELAFILDNYRRNGLDISNFETIRNIYAPLEDGNANWLGNVSAAYSTGQEEMGSISR